MDDTAVRDLFDRIAGDFLGRPGVGYGRIWHNDGLTVHTKIFAMVVRGQLVVKIPAAQAAQLCEQGVATAFAPRPGRPMREWVCLDPPADRAGEQRWRQWISDAYDYGLRLTGGTAQPQAGTPQVSRSASSKPPPGTGRRVR